MLQTVHGRTGPVTLTVLIVSHNTRDLTLSAIESICSTTADSHRVIVVDNGSSDGSAEAIRERFPFVGLIALEANIGFARANNLAAKRAEGQYLLLLNPDTIVLPRAVDGLLAFARRRPEARIWGGRTWYPDGTLNPSSCWKRMTLWSVLCRSVGASMVWHASALFNPEAYPGWARDSERSVDIVTGCFLLIEREFWNALDGFDSAYFMYGEEADLCLRARVLGADPAITPEAEIVHFSGASRSDSSSKTIQLLAARIRLIKHHFPVWQQPVAITLIRGGVVLRLVMYWVAATLTARHEALDVIRKIWQAREQWWYGY